MGYTQAVDATTTLVVANCQQLLMGREKRISNAQCALYGSKVYDPHEQQAQWRHRISNERVGAPTIDQSGINVSVSMLWDSPAASAAQCAYRESKKRASQLKLVQDCGVRDSPRTNSASS